MRCHRFLSVPGERIAPVSDLAEVMRRALGLGHVLALEERGRFFVTCSCGYRSAGRMTRGLASDAGAHHLRKAVRAAHVDGVSA